MALDRVGETRVDARVDGDAPEATLVERIVELFDGEVVGPGPEGEKV